MSSEHTHAIDVGKVDATELDGRMQAAINWLWLALKAIGEAKGLLPTLIGTQLRLFWTTHKSIRILIGKLQNDPRYFADARSLLREQVEKVFVITLTLDNPDKWLRQYFEAGGRRSTRSTYCRKGSSVDCPGGSNS